MGGKELVPSTCTYADSLKCAGKCGEFLRRWVMGVMAGLCEVDEETARRILRRAGEECCKIFLEVYGYDLSDQDLDSLIRLLGSSPSSGCYRVDEDTIIYEFKSERCECPLVEMGVAGLSSRLCSACFTNWLSYMFSTVTKRRVKAEFIESLATGASKCTFKIKLL
jgi:predicted hydrocarbon binding protein